MFNAKASDIASKRSDFFIFYHDFRTDKNLKIYRMFINMAYWVVVDISLKSRFSYNINQVQESLLGANAVSGKCIDNVRLHTTISWLKISQFRPTNL